jgi:hypothetical protein
MPSVSILDEKSHQFVLKIARMLRLYECRMMLASILPNLSNFDVKNDIKSMAKIWNIEKNVVPLHCQS